MRGLILGLCLALSACGEEEPIHGGGAGTRLVVEVKPTGESAGQRRVIRELPAGITRADFAPVPRDTACAEIYGGPATARVDGTLEGRPLHAKFDRTNACEMERWDRVAALLGPAPDSGASPPSPPADADRP